MGVAIVTTNRNGVEIKINIQTIKKFKLFSLTSNLVLQIKGKNFLQQLDHFEWK